MARARSSQDEEEIYQQNRDMLEGNMSYLTRRIQPRDFICHLREKQIFDKTDQEEIENKYVTTVERNRLLIDKVLMKGTPGIEAFLTVLEYEHGDCYLKITKKQPRPKPEEWRAQSLRRNTARGRTLELSQALTLVAQAFDRELQQREVTEKQHQKLKGMIEELEDELVELQQQLDIKQNDIITTTAENMNLKTQLASVQAQLLEATDKKCQYIQEFKNEKKKYEAALRDSGVVPTSPIFKSMSMCGSEHKLDIVDELISEINKFKERDAVQQTEISKLKDKLERVEESHAALNQIYYDKTPNHRHSPDSTIRPFPSVVKPSQELAEDAMHILEFLSYHELSEWHIYHSAYTETQLEISASVLQQVGIAGGNFCDLYVENVPPYVTNLHTGEAITEIKEDKKTHRLVGVTKEDALKLFDTLNGKIKITIRKDQENSCYKSLAVLMDKDISGGDCFCVNILKNYNDTTRTNAEDLPLEGGMIVMVTDTNYNTGGSTPSTPTTPTDGAMPAKRSRWRGEILSPGDGERTGRKGNFFALSGFTRSMGRRSNDKRVQSFAMSKYRYVRPHKALYKRPVVILSSEESSNSLVDCIKDADEIFIEDSDDRASRIQELDQVIERIPRNELIQYKRRSDGQFHCLCIENLLRTIKTNKKHLLMDLSLAEISKMLRAEIHPIILVVKVGDESLQIEREIQNDLFIQNYDYETIELSAEAMESKTQTKEILLKKIKQTQNQLVWLEEEKPLPPISK